MRVFDTLEPRRRLPSLSERTKRRRPRDYVEWKTLREWGELPPWEEVPPGYLLRDERERAGLTQAALGELGGGVRLRARARARADRISLTGRGAPG